MSRKLLLDLNGNHSGRLHAWLARFNGNPRIAWYPSAGTDMRDLLYLSLAYANLFPGSGPEPRSPDIYLHTDYFPWQSSTFLDTPVVFSDPRTTVRVAHLEQLPRLDLPLDPGLVHFPDGSDATGRVLFMELDIRSDVLGRFRVPLIYAFVENTAFCALKLLPNNAQISHIVHVRYGGGLGGGGFSNGIWLLNVLRKLGCECLVTEERYSRGDTGERAYELYPELAGDETTPPHTTIRTVPGAAWSQYGDVAWQVMGCARK